MCKSHDLALKFMKKLTILSFSPLLNLKHHHILPPLSSPPPLYLPLALKPPPTSIPCLYIYNPFLVRTGPFYDAFLSQRH
ncbi:hypothetical protein LguiB_013686 [Lonicera macranthoides]